MPAEGMPVKIIARKQPDTNRLLFEKVPEPLSGAGCRDAVRINGAQYLAGLGIAKEAGHPDQQIVEALITTAESPSLSTP